MKLVRNEMLTSISFESLQFVEPFSHRSESKNHFNGKVVFLAGVTRRPGISIVRYIDINGVLRYKFKRIKNCLYSSALRTYKFLISEKKATNIEFASIPVPIETQPKVLDILKREYLNTRVDNHFEIIRPWLEGERVADFPFERLTFRRPFNEFNRCRRFSFLDYNGRDGLYIIREYLVHEDKMINAYVGKSSSGILSGRINFKFYPNRHLYYKEDVGVREYYITAIEIQRSMFPKRTPYDDIIERYETTLINLLETRDNKLGVIHDIDIETGGGYVPLLQNDEEGF